MNELTKVWLRARNLFKICLCILRIVNMRIERTCDQTNNTFLRRQTLTTIHVTIYEILYQNSLVKNTCICKTAKQRPRQQELHGNK